jgi:hypothetical protein
MHERLDHPQDMDRHAKKESIHNQLGERMLEQDVAGCEEKEYVWQDGQWCPGGLTRSQKRRVQCLRNQELKENRHQVW